MTARLRSLFVEALFATPEVVGAVTSRRQVGRCMQCGQTTEIEAIDPSPTRRPWVQAHGICERSEALDVRLIEARRHDSLFRRTVVMAMSLGVSPGHIGRAVGLSGDRIRQIGRDEWQRAARAHRGRARRAAGMA